MWEKKNSVMISSGGFFCNLLRHDPEFLMPWGKVFENIVGKGDIAGNQHSILLPQCF